MNSEAEFVAMIKSHEGTIYKVIYSYSRKKNEIKDLYQEVVYQLWKSYPKFKGKSSINTWLYRVVFNTVLTYQKREKKWIQKIDDLAQLNLDYSYNHDLDSKITHLYEAIHSLNKIDRAIILLKLEGCSYSEIAEVVGISSTNVGTKISRIKSNLFSMIKFYDNEN